MNVPDRLALGLLERGDELATLSALLDGARGGDGSLVVVEGPAGIGKTSLLDACAGAAGDGGMLVLRVRGDELVMESSFAAVRELLWQEVARDPAAFEGAARLAAPVFEPNLFDGVNRDLAGTVLHGLYWLVAGVAERRALALVVDDAHWLDAASARFLVYLAQRLESLAAVLVVGLRRGEAPGMAGFGAALESLAARVLRPAALSEDASAVLVRGVLGPRAGEELCRSCHRATGGNPFYLRELASALNADRGALTVEAASRVRELGAGAIGRSVLVRLARLGDDCERLSQATAVLGPGSPLRHAATLAELPRERAEAAADALRAAELLAPDLELSFAHPIVSEAVAAELRASRRSALHREAARVLLDDFAPADRVAAHLLSTEPYGEAWAVDALRAAGRDALARGAPEAAASYLRRALAEPPGDDVRLDVLIELGRAETMLPLSGEFGALHEAIELASDPRRRAEIVLLLTEALLGVGRFPTARLLIAEILEESDRLDTATVERLEGHLIGGGVADFSGSREVLARAEPQFERARRGKVQDPVLLAALAISGAASGLPASDAAALGRLALRDERLRESWPALGAATVTLTWADELEDAAAAQDAIIAESQRRGSQPMFLQAATFRSLTALFAGDLDVAEDHAQRALDIAPELSAQVFALQHFGAIMLERARPHEAADILEPIPLHGDLLTMWPGVILLAERGRIRIAVGELDRGLADLLEAERITSDGGCDLSVLTDWVPDAAMAMVSLGRGDEALALAARELAAARAFGAGRRYGAALGVCGSLESGESGLATLREAVVALERSPARLERVRALVNLGAGLGARGLREEARKPLFEALDAARRMGAAALAERARAELIAVGARPRRDALRGPEALTPAELRTARMAADGMSNREIAQALFLSTRTVEAQLSGAYAKLAISSRGKLADALRTRRGGKAA